VRRYTFGGIFMYILGGLIFIGTFTFAFKAVMGGLTNETILMSLAMLTISCLAIVKVLYY